MKIMNIILGIVITFAVVAALLPTFTSAGDSINAASGGSALGALFSSGSGILIVILLGGLLVAVYKKLSGSFGR